MHGAKGVGTVVVKRGLVLLYGANSGKQVMSLYMKNYGDKCLACSSMAVHIVTVREGGFSPVLLKYRYCERHKDRIAAYLDQFSDPDLAHWSVTHERLI